MSLSKKLPVALTIAGSDSGGGAGIQADLKTFAALGAFGTSAITAITAQNPSGVSAIQGIDPDVVAKQITAVSDYFVIGAIKTGMLFSTEIIEAVADSISIGLATGANRVPVVVDPVMVATSGAKLLNDDAIGALQSKVLPLASLITPNMDEAALLADMTVEAVDHLEPAAHAIFDRYGVPVLVKGGHLQGESQTVDVLWDGKELRRFQTPFVKRVGTHGTGCTLSSAIAVFLLQGHSLAEAVDQGKRYLQNALSNSLPAGKETTLNHSFAPRPLSVG